MTARRIIPAMTVLEVVSSFPATQPVFRSCDAAAGGCLLCEALFDTIDAVASRYNLDLPALLEALETAAQGPGDDA